MSGEANGMPIRSEFWQGGTLREVGADLAGLKALDLISYHPFRLSARIDDNRAAVRQTYLRLLAQTGPTVLVTPAAEWLLDNHHIVDETFRHLRRDLSVRVYRELPTVKLASGEAVPRTLALVWTYVAVSNSDLGLSSLAELVEGFQTVSPLTIGEVWSVPALLRFVLLENLRRLADRIDAARQARARANGLADSLAATRNVAPAMLAEHARDRGDESFASQLLYRLRESDDAGMAALHWLEQGMAEAGMTPDQAIAKEQSNQSSGNVTVGNIIRSLKAIDDIDWLAWFEQVSRVDAILNRDPNYALLDKATRNHYRTQIERIARRSTKTESEVAAMVATASDQDPGVALTGAGRLGLEQACGYRPTVREHVLRFYRGLGWLGVAFPCVVVTLLTAFAMATLAQVSLPLSVVWVLLALLPATDAAMSLVHFLAARLIPAAQLPGFDYSGDIPETARTIVVIPCLLTNRDDIDDLIRNLELHYLANPKGAVSFALLSDWVDAPRESRADDADLLDHAKAGIDDLADRYSHDGGRRFFLLHRARLYNPGEAVWMGWERKRGKLVELNSLLRDDEDTSFVETGARPEGHFKYVITLDADTRLTRGSVPAMVGKLAHPVNRAVIGPKGKITSGYGILQPRVTPSLTTGADASIFQRIFSTNRGLDPYVFTVSDLYQDLLGEGNFTGKGIYDIDAFRAATDGAIDENAVLSHDLLEGSLARAALVTDVQFVEDFPVQYHVDAARLHRWARGDWQLLPYIFGRNTRLNGLARLKMIDNLRRSLVPIGWVAASVFGWLTLRPAGALHWQAALLATLIAGPTLSFLNGLAPRDPSVRWGLHLRTLADEAVDFAALTLFRVAFLADWAAIMADAIVRTIYRVFVSRKHLLEWRTASQVAASGTGSVAHYLRRMAASVALGAAAIAVTALINPQALTIAFPIAALWIAAPIIAWLISRTEESIDHLDISPSDATDLRRIARLTWWFFEDFVTPASHHLPPDNFQDTPARKIAERTSPTNIGLYLLSVVSAREFGWISQRNAADRIEATLTTIEALPKYRGHLFNWYSTADLSVLQPQYISSVDSGNLAGHLVSLSAALRQWAEGPSVHLPPDARGIGDVLDVVRHQVGAIPDDRRTLRPLRRRVEERIVGFAESYATYLAEPQLAPVRGINLTVIARDIEKLARALNAEVDTEAVSDLVRWSGSLIATCQAVIEDTSGDLSNAAAMQSRLGSLAERARALAFAMDFAFLMDPAKRLLTVGYNVDGGKADPSCYDLLASEARLASFFAIAKGDLPNEHWFRLGRPVTSTRTSGVLLSWSGSMFEYLMPLLVMKERVGSVLHQSDVAAIRAQIDEARGTGRPWGVSESAMNARDAEMNYQYYAFGVAKLALKRGRSDDHVVAPYSTVLAAQIFPRQSVQNLARLNALGALGPHGYFDAVDMTRDRMPDGVDHVVVRSVMAHHQGMIIVAVANAVMEGIHRDRFHADPVVQAAELLLQEKAPREIVPVTRAAKLGAGATAEMMASQSTQTTVSDPARAERAVGLLSNGSYARMLTASGAGWSHFGDTAVTRWRPDPTCEMDGSFIFLRDLVTNRWWSATAAPKSAPDEVARTIFSDHKAEFLKTVGTIETHLETIVATEANAEGSRLTIRNKGSQTRSIEVTTYGEIVMDVAAADRAHPAFSKMFVQTHISPDRTTITATRNLRDPGPQLHLAHMLVGPGPGRSVQAETDRRAFIGRGRNLATAIAFEPEATLAGEDGFTLDPCYALRRTLRIAPGKDVVLNIWTIVAADETALQSALDHYRNPATFDHESRLGWTRSQIELRRANSSLEEIAVFREAARHLLFPDQRLGAHEDGAGRQSALWPLGISGDNPIITLRIDTESDLPIARKSLRLIDYLRGKGVKADLVLLNEQTTGYVQDLQNALTLIVDQSFRLVSPAVSKSVHLLRRDMVPPVTVQNLLASAQIVLHARNGTWSEQFSRLPRNTPVAPVLLLLPPQSINTAPKLEFPVEALEFPNDFGGFADDGRTYVIRLRHGQATPHPWLNIIARDGFGFHVSAEGAGYTWAANSRDYQISPWSNDPVSNPAGEGIVIRDRLSGRSATPFATLSDDPDALYETRHSPGQSVFRTTTRWLNIESVQELSAEGPAKITQLTLHNHGDRPLELDVLAWTDLVLGNNRAAAAPKIRVHHDVALNALCAVNPWNDEYPDRMTALGANRPIARHRATRRGLIDAFSGALLPGKFDWPSGDGATETLGDPCLAITTRISLAPGASANLTFALADAPIAAMPALMRRIFPTSGTVPFVKAKSDDWHAILDTLQVQTPDRRFDIMINTWLPYQTLSCRIHGRSAFYQASGAYGFRDQLQDTAAMILQDPKLARGQVLAAAGRQFVEGDVQHWWLPATGAGVRTLIADDVVWLGNCTARYVAMTGDVAVLDEPVRYLAGAKLGVDQHDAFYTPTEADLTESLYDHCARALDLALERTGVDGIPLMLGGDWNDGMNRVGILGKGESTWLGWFLCQTIDDFAPLAEARGDTVRANRWRAHRDSVAQALDDKFWDGAWYRRGTFDDGTPLGSDGAAACKIDSIAQTWASLSGAAPAERADQALNAALAHLKDESAGIMRLFTPAFDGKTGPDPGYIAAYPPGVRENGGQYTHAATWMIYALARAGRGNDAHALFDLINPISHALTRADANRYRVEPYVVAADIYGEGTKTGRGGWTWYTGAAGWLYRAGVEGILGISLQAGVLTVSPVLPDSWSGYSATVRRGGKTQHISVRRDGTGVVVEIDGKPVRGGDANRTKAGVLGAKGSLAQIG